MKRFEKFESKIWTTPPTPEELAELLRDSTDEEVAEINTQMKAERDKLSPQQQEELKAMADMFDRWESETGNEED